MRWHFYCSCCCVANLITILLTLKDLRRYRKSTNVESVGRYPKERANIVLV